MAFNFGLTTTKKQESSFPLFKTEPAQKNIISQASKTSQNVSPDFNPFLPSTQTTQPKNVATGQIKKQANITFQRSASTNQGLARYEKIESNLKTLQSHVIINQDQTKNNSNKIKKLEQNEKISHNNEKLMMNSVKSNAQKIQSLTQQNQNQRKIIQGLSSQVKSQNTKIQQLTNYLNLVIHSMNSLHKLNQPQTLRYKSKNEDNYQEQEEFYLKEKQFKKPKQKPRRQYTERNAEKKPQVHPLSHSQVFQYEKDSKDQILKGSFSARNTDLNTKNNFFKKKNEVKVQKYGDYYVTSEKSKTSNLSNNVIIENRFGKIVFTEPIDLQDKEIEECVEIEQDLADILEDDWKKNCKIELFNFKDYKNIENEDRKAQLKKEITEEMAADEIMKFERLDDETGNLHIEMKYE